MSSFETASFNLHEGLSFLSQWKLKARGDQISQSELLGRRLLVTYSSTVVDTAVRIYYSPARDGRAARLSAFVDAGGGRSFFVDDYLSSHGLNKLLAFFQNTNPERPLDEFCRRFSSIFRVIVENSFAGVLSGETSSIPPFDWGPYK